jgi:hypothetical protein
MWIQKEKQKGILTLQRSIQRMDKPEQQEVTSELPKEKSNLQ